MSRRKATGLLLAITVLAAIAFNASNLIEAYGSGPPYYSRTMNMDKWESPLPILSSVDVLAAIAVAAFIASGRSRGQK